MLAKVPSISPKAPPRTANYGLVGTAFDYALRFELQRRNPHAIARAWVADEAVERIPEAAELAGLSKKRAKELEKQGARVLDAARAFVATFVASATPNLQQLAKHALLLAELDNVFRALALDGSPFQIDPEDVRDVVDLMAIVPYVRLSHPKTILLNPTFGTYSSVAGGADADLVSGDLLVEVKTSKSAEVRREAVRQLLVYLMLARRARAEDGEFPEIRNLGIYLARHAHLWELPVAMITAHAKYAETEEWLIRFAAETEMDPALRELWEVIQEDSRAATKPKRARRAIRDKKKSRRRS
jgi:hypothetical protein